MLICLFCYSSTKQRVEGYIPSVVSCSTRGVGEVGVCGGGGRERGDITWLALTQFNIQDMSALWKMQLHVSQWDAAFIHAEKMYI